ncbi:hypothetical protein [Micromonospora fulviviridis]|uniref:hypothetical protein n=1 Tax=Micromonospora fulviviridis TaxID=47860 RepID=UPI0037967078
MNKIIVWMQSSLDGLYLRTKRRVRWPYIGNDLHTHFVTTLREAGLFVYGRAVFEMMAAFWPIADTLETARRTRTRTHGPGGPCPRSSSPAR